jgi:hypothetical protein
MKKKKAFYMNCIALRRTKCGVLKQNKKWIGLVMHTAKRQIVAFDVGRLAKEDAQALFDPPF